MTVPRRLFGVMSRAFGQVSLDQAAAVAFGPMGPVVSAVFTLLRLQQGLESGAIEVLLHGQQAGSNTGVGHDFLQRQLTQD